MELSLYFTNSIISSFILWQTGNNAFSNMNSEPRGPKTVNAALAATVVRASGLRWLPDGFGHP